MTSLVIHCINVREQLCRVAAGLGKPGISREFNEPGVSREKTVIFAMKPGIGRKITKIYK